MTSPDQAHELAGRLLSAMKDIDPGTCVPCSALLSNGEPRISRDGSFVTAKWPLSEFGIEPPLEDRVTRALRMETVEHRSSIKFFESARPPYLTITVDLSVSSLHELAKASLALWGIAHSSENLQAERAADFDAALQERIAPSTVYLPHDLSTDPKLAAYSINGDFRAYHFQGTVGLCFFSSIVPGTPEAEEATKKISERELILTWGLHEQGLTRLEIRGTTTQTRTESQVAQTILDALREDLQILKPVAQVNIPTESAAESFPNIKGVNALREDIRTVLGQFPDLHYLWHQALAPTAFEFEGHAGFLLKLPTSRLGSPEIVAAIQGVAAEHNVAARPMRIDGSPVLGFECQVNWETAAQNVEAKRRLIAFMHRLAGIVPQE